MTIWAAPDVTIASPAYVGNADMIQPDLTPLQPSLDDFMEISGDAVPSRGQRREHRQSQLEESLSDKETQTSARLHWESGWSGSLWSTFVQL